MQVQIKSNSMADDGCAHASPLGRPQRLRRVEASKQAS
jgi:hypothetical protein